MKKLLFILLLLPFLAQGQTTYQLNYDSIRVGKTAGTGGTSLYGKVYLKNTTTGLSTDSLLVWRAGKIFRVLNTASAYQPLLSGTGIVKSTAGTISYLTDPLPIANGGTGSATQNFVDLTTDQSIGGAKTLTGALTGTSAEFSRISIGVPPVTTYNFYNAAPITGGIDAGGNYLNSIIQSDVTTIAFGNRQILSTQAAPFNLTTLYHFIAEQGTIGAGSSVTTQYGFAVENTLTGATTNYGFHGNIPAGTGRWNLYMNGTAPNYLAGDLTVNTLTNGLVKSTSGLLSNATAGTDYLTPTGSAAALTSFPTFNQNTTGSAATLTTTRTIWGQNFNGSANVSGALTGVTAITMSGALSGATSGTFTDGTQGLVIRPFTLGAGYGAIYPVGVTPGSANYAFLAGTSSVEINASTNNLLLVGGVARLSLTATTITSSHLAGTGDRIIYANASGLLGSLVVGSGLSLSAGTLSATGGSAGTVTGSGTAGYIGKWTSASNMANSIMSESGSAISVAGTMSATSATFNSLTTGTVNGGFIFQQYPAGGGYGGMYVYGVTPGNSNFIIAAGEAESAFGYGSVLILNHTSKLATFSGALTGTSATFSSTISASNLSGTNTGDQTSVTGNAGTATALQTARTISGTSFNGSANITLNNTGITNGAGYVTSSALSPYATLASPALTGTPTAPTATAGTNTTQIATTAYTDAAFNFAIAATKQLNVTYATLSSVTGNSTLDSYTIPANGLSANGDRVDFEYGGNYASNGNIKNSSVVIDGVSVGAFSSTSNGTGWSIAGTIIRESSTAYRVILDGRMVGGTGFYYNGTVTNFTSGLNVQFVAAAATTAGDLSLHMSSFTSTKAP